MKGYHEQADQGMYNAFNQDVRRTNGRSLIVAVPSFMMREEPRISAAVLRRLLCALLSAYGGEYVESATAAIKAMAVRKGGKCLVYLFHLRVRTYATRLSLDTCNARRCRTMSRQVLLTSMPSTNLPCLVTPPPESRTVSAASRFRCPCSKQ